MLFRIIFFCFILFFVFSLYSLKFNNPHKLYFIFGKKGSGKSTYLVKLMKRDLKKGWTVYTNMQDCMLKGVRIFDVTELQNKKPDPHSSLYIDEGGIIFDNRNYKNFHSGYTEFFKLQRHYFTKVYITSQSWDIDLKLRNLCDGLFLMTNIGNVIGIVRPIKRSITLTEPTSEAESRIADKLEFAHIWNWKFNWMPRYFKYFNSFVAPERDSMSWYSNFPSDVVESSVEQK